MQLHQQFLTQLHWSQHIKNSDGLCSSSPVTCLQMAQTGSYDGQTGSYRCKMLHVWQWGTNQGFVHGKTHTSVVISVFALAVIFISCQNTHISQRAGLYRSCDVKPCDFTWILIKDDWWCLRARLQEIQITRRLYIMQHTWGVIFKQTFGWHFQPTSCAYLT